jgi:cbb3-type cytochrome oxidase subunit 1
VTVESAENAGPEDPPSPDQFPAPTSTDAAPYIRVALVFLAISVAVGIVAGLQLLVPELLAGVEYVTYGRLYPIAVNLFIYGWLTIGLSGALLHVMSRAGKVRVESPTSVRLGLLLLSLGVIAGSAGIALGFNEGRQYLEYPLWADALIVLGLLAVMRSLTSTTRAAKVDPGPVRWYGLAAMTWFTFGFVVGNIPGIPGIAVAFQTSFFRAILLGLWLGAGGVALVYHVVPRLVGRESVEPTRLTVIGFWSLAFVWALAAPANLTYSPAPDWLETLGGLFSIGLVIPPMVIFADLVLALRRRWSVAGGEIRLRVVMLGAVLFGLWPVAALALALRAPGGVLQFTDWVRALDGIAIYGFATVWLIAFVGQVAPELLDGAVSPRRARIHYFGTLLGLFIWLGALMLSGVTAGFTWVASANEAAVPAAGLGFSNTLAGIEPYVFAAFVGLTLYGLSQLLYVAAAVSGGEARERSEADDIVEPAGDPELRFEGSISPGLLRWGSLALVAVAGVLVWLVPWAETSQADATLLADGNREFDVDGGVSDGRAIYLQEGCWYCHTQQVRPIVTDVGLGPASVVGDYVHETPVLFGVQRIGPDLMHVGSRPQTDDVDWVRAYLADPRSERAYSLMPSYDHLTSSELDDLAAYIVNSK